MSNIELIRTTLMDDAALVGTLGASGYGGILQGGVWTRALKREPPGNTPEAFYDSDKGRMIRPSAVLLDRGDTPHRQRAAIPSAYEQTVPIYLYAPATASGKQAMVNARRRIYSLLNDIWMTTENGWPGYLMYIDRLGITDSEEFPEAVYDLLRYRLTSRITNEDD